MARRRLLPLTQEEINAAVRDYYSGLSVREVGDKYGGRPYSSTHGMLEKAGVVFRSRGGSRKGSRRSRWV